MFSSRDNQMFWSFEYCVAMNDSCQPSAVQFHMMRDATGAWIIGTNDVSWWHGVKPLFWVSYKQSAMLTWWVRRMNTTHTSGLGRWRKGGGLLCGRRWRHCTLYQHSRLRVTPCDKANITFCKWVSLHSMTCGKWKIWTSGLMGTLCCSSSPAVTGFLNA